VGIVLVFALILSQQAIAFQKTYYDPNDPGHNVGMSIIEVPNSPDETVVAGTLYGTSAGNELIHISRIDHLGSPVWSYIYTSTEATNQRCMAIEHSINDGFIVTGYYEEVATGLHKSLIFEIDANGNLIWHRTYDELTVGLTILKTSTNSGYLVGGFEANDITEITTSRVATVLSIDGAGNPNWQRSYMSQSIAVSAPEEYYDFVETIVEVSPSEFYITGSISGIQTSTSGQIKVQKVLSAMVDASGNSIWEQSFGEFSASAVITDNWEIGADAQYDQNEDVVYLLVNNWFTSLSEHRMTIYTIDKSNGAILSEVPFKQGSSFFDVENFHANQILVNNSTVEVYGYVTTLNEPNCNWDPYYFPFQFTYQKGSPANNVMEVNFNESYTYPPAMQGFLRIRSNPVHPPNLPLVHTPEMTIKSWVEGNYYYRFLSYAIDFRFELFNTHPNGQGICRYEQAELSVETPIVKTIIPFAFSGTVMTHDHYLPYSNQFVALTDDDCLGIVCPTRKRDAVTAIVEGPQQEENTFTIYPVPANGSVTVEYSMPIDNDATITLINLMGKEQFKVKLTATTRLDVSALQAGTYIVQIVNGDEQTNRTIVLQ